MENFRRIDTYEDYELIRDGLLQHMSQEDRDEYGRLKQRLQFREKVKNDELRKPKGDCDNKTFIEYHNSYNDLINFEKKHGLLEIAKDFAETQAVKYKYKYKVA